MIAPMMQRLMIQAEPELLERAKRRARERGVSVAQVVREAMEHELGVDDEEEPLAPPLKCIGAFASGRGDLSRRRAKTSSSPSHFADHRHRAVVGDVRSQ